MIHMFVVQEDNFPVCYIDWAEWRDVRIEAEDEFSLAGAPMMCFCAVCWGAGRILEYAANGEGLVPTTCTHCGGVGSVPTR